MNCELESERGLLPVKNVKSGVLLPVKNGKSGVLLPVKNGKS